jgi:hypothetical protein
MCSILALLDLRGDPAPLRARALRLSRLQRHFPSGGAVCPSSAGTPLSARRVSACGRLARSPGVQDG